MSARRQVGSLERIAEDRLPESGFQGPTYVLIRDYLDILDMSCGLEDLTQHILRHPLVETPHVECALVRLGSGTSSEATSAAGRHDVVYAGHGRGDGGRDRVGVLWDVQRRRRHVSLVGLAILVARRPRIGLRGELRGGSSTVGHGVSRACVVNRVG